MAKTCYLWNNTYYRTDVIFFWAKKPFKSSCNFKYMHYANGLPVYNYNSCVHWYVEQFVSSRLGLWYKPWFYLHVQTFLKKVNLNFTTFAIQNNTDFGIATNPILVSDTPWNPISEKGFNSANPISDNGHKATNPVSDKCKKCCIMGFVAYYGGLLLLGFVAVSDLCRYKDDNCYGRVRLWSTCRPFTSTSGTTSPCSGWPRCGFPGPTTSSPGGLTSHIVVKGQLKWNLD